jgi:hypothetical protein
MKFTQHFLYTRQRPDRVGIELAWIESVIAAPMREEVQPDGRVRL